MAYAPVQEKEMLVGPVLRAYAKATWRYPAGASLLLLASLVTQATSVILPIYLKDLVNLLASGSASAAVVRSLFGILAIYAVISVIRWIARQTSAFSLSHVESRVMADLENDGFRYLIRHSHEFFLSSFAGTLTRRVTRYSRAYEQILDNIVFNVLPTLLFAIGSIGVLWYRNTWLGLGLFVWTVVFITAQILLNRWRQPLRVERTAKDSAMTGALSDAITNHSAITHYASERFEEHKFGTAVDTWRRAMKRSWDADEVIQGVQQVLSLVIELGLLGGAILLWKRGELSVGDFVLIQVYILGLLSHIWRFGNTLRNFYDAISDGSEMIKIMETPHEIQDAPNAQSLVCANGAIKFDAVQFAYANGRTVLHDLSLQIGGGEKAAFVGPSGAGKTTITKVLLRLYNPTVGAIRIDGQDISSVTQESLRRAISYVPQEPALFHRSLRDNIAYGKPDATEEEIIEAAKQAHCHEFISGLQDGYDTLVGERGVKLSGGERQRVAIARAILKNAPILVLDEATSSLDSESEALIQDALARLMEGKTVIAIAHRLSTIMKMDRIIVMEQGRVALTGTHQELLAQGGNLYQKLWELQAGSFTQAV